MAKFDPIPALAATQRHLVARRQLVLHGIGNGSLASLIDRRQLWRVARGVYMLPGGEWDYPTAVLAAVLAGPLPAWASHRCALGLYGLTDTRMTATGPAPKIELTVTMGGLRRSSSIELHRSRLLPDHHLIEHDGVPVTSQARTLADMAALNGPNTVRGWAAEALRKRLVTFGALVSMVEELPPARPGWRTWQQVVGALESEDRAPGISELEFQATKLLSSAALAPRWERHIAPPDAGWLGRVDALFLTERLVVEFDGSAFHDRWADARRDRDLLRSGYLVLRFSWLDITQRGEVVIAEIRAALAGRRALLGVGTDGGCTA